jgi:protein-L-isoaspartate(D-aspartate) O-methyltransferase
MTPDCYDPEIARSKMIEQQIRPWNVLDPNVLELLAEIRREDFVPAGHRHLAFVDMEIPLPEHQVMLAPKTEARLLQELDLISSDRVLEIGTGSGFFAAMMARLSGHVLTVEKHESLVALAKDNLARAGISNVELVHANGLAENPAWGYSTFDAIAISGAVTAIPAHILSLLKPGARMVAIVGQAPVMQAVLIRRTSNASASAAESNSTVTLFETLTKPLEDGPKISQFKF